MPALSAAKHQSVPGPVIKVILLLDRACAPAEYGCYREARTGMISQVKVSALSGGTPP